MKLFFFDTETTGVNPHKDRIIQFGAIYGEYDLETEQFNELKRINQYINIDEEIPWGASKVHGIYKKDLAGCGYIQDYIDEFLLYMGKSDYVVGHNVEFDRGMLIGEAKRLGSNFDFDAIRWIDTMKPTTEFVNGKGGKRPKLIALHTKLFGVGFDGAHDAMADIIATKDCFFELKKYGFWGEIFGQMRSEDNFLGQEPRLSGGTVTDENKIKETDFHALWQGTIENLKPTAQANLKDAAIIEQIVGGKVEIVVVSSIAKMLITNEENKKQIIASLERALGAEVELDLKFESKEAYIARKMGIEEDSQQSQKKSKYDTVLNFSSGYASVALGGKRGFINEQGEEICQLKYDQVWGGFEDGYASVALGGKRGFINEQGEEICQLKYDKAGYFENGYSRVSLGGKRGFINEQGEEICQLKYDQVGYFENGYHFKDGYACVALGGKRGIINEQGEEICQLKYDKVGGFRNGYARVEFGGKRGFINEQGEEICQLKYDKVGYFENGYSRVSLGGKQGFINEEGEEICQLKYDEVWYFKDGYTSVALGGKRGFINEQGEEICQLKYDEVWGGSKIDMLE